MFLEQRADEVYQERYQPCQYEGVEDGEPCPAFPRLAAQGGDGGNTGEVEQGEEHEAEGGNGCERRRGDIAAVEYRHRGDDSLLGRQTRQQADRHLPIEAQRAQYRRYCLAYHCQIGVLKVVHVLRGEVLQCPDDDGRP